MVKHLMFIMVFIFSLQTYSATVIRISTDNPEDSLHVYTLKKINEHLQKSTNGELKIKIYYRGNKEAPAIKGEEVNVNMVVAGDSSIDGTVVAVGNLGISAKILNFFMLPYIFPTPDSAKKLFRSDYLNKEVNSTLEQKHNIRVISWLLGGYRHLTNSKVAVRKIEDIKGLKIRTPRNKIMSATYRAFGAEVKPLNWGDVPAALTSGEIDGQENPYTVIHSMKFWNNKQKYLTKTGPFLFVANVVINKNIYSKLPANLQAALDKAGQQAQEDQWKWLEGETNKFVTDLKKNGMQILELEDKDKWIGATKNIYKSSYRDIGYGDEKKGKELIDKVQSIAK